MHHFEHIPVSEVTAIQQLHHLLPRAFITYLNKQSCVEHKPVNHLHQNNELHKGMHITYSAHPRVTSHTWLNDTSSNNLCLPLLLLTCGTHYFLAVYLFRS